MTEHIRDIIYVYKVEKLTYDNAAPKETRLTRIYIKMGT